jgi:hypothetical protein
MENNEEKESKKFLNNAIESLHKEYEKVSGKVFGLSNYRFTQHEKRIIEECKKIIDNDISLGLDDTYDALSLGNALYTKLRFLEVDEIDRKYREGMIKKYLRIYANDANKIATKYRELQEQERMPINNNKTRQE